MKEKLEIDLNDDLLTEKTYVSQSCAARLLAQFRNIEKISRQYVSKVANSGRIRVEDRKVNLFDILHLRSQKTGRPRKEEHASSSD
ncbi:MAG TPA: hypothetical protein PLP33_24775 [Leptospiraceae bacterium]|nr:hypothetical protein [Leptospiraceae bacterium]